MNTILMTEEFWANSILATVRCTSQIRVQGKLYILVDKFGRDMFECSSIAEKEGRQYAVEPGEPLDLIDARFQKTYRKVGRDLFIAALNAGCQSPKEIEAWKGGENVSWHELPKYKNQ